jgi:hypothetical protein
VLGGPLGQKVVAHGGTIQKEAVPALAEGGVGIRWNDHLDVMLLFVAQT